MITTGFSKQLEMKGRFPPVSLEIKPLGTGRQILSFDKFLSYTFTSSLLVPVDQFSFTLSAPDDPYPFSAYCSEGDIAMLWADQTLVATGIIDQIEIEVNGESGESASVHGRDLLGQLEDNSAVSYDAKPIWGQSMTLEGAGGRLIEGTRIQKVVLLDAPQIATLFATEPGESRLSALLRLMEPLNVIAWASPNGDLVIGRPQFHLGSRGTLVCSREKRTSNVLSMRSTASATSIPNRLAVLWSDVQSTQIGLPANQIFDNKANGPTRLRQAGHLVLKTLMTSLPSGKDAQSLQSSAVFQAADAAGETVLQSMAKRELARANFNELIVQAVVPGHWNDKGEAYMPNTVYSIDFDRAGIQEEMFCFAVDWALTPERGQYSVLSFCRLNTIVSDTRIKRPQRLGATAI
jgi:prophage tail gpP-like protein